MAEQSVSRAARLVGISQPSMSHALGRLRSLFGDSLFVSTHGVMAPTQRAKTLQPGIRDLLARSDALLGGSADFDPETASLEFTMMAAEYVEYLLFPALINRLKIEAPGVKLVFQTADRDRAFERLEQGGLDFRLAWWPEPAVTLHSKPLFSDPYVCVARRHHPAIRDGRISEDDFVSTSHVVIQPARSGIAYQAIVNSFSHRRFTLKAAMQVQSAMNLCNAVSSTDYLACLPERFAREMATKFSLEMAPAPFPVAEACQSIYWHERTHRLASHRWFRALVSEVASRL